MIVCTFMYHTVTLYTMRIKIEQRNHKTDCGVEATLEILGGKWKGVILYQLRDELKRFNQLHRLLPNITQRMLTRQLRELEHDGLVNRKVYAQVPPKVEYSLTDTGTSLIPIIMLLKDWGDSNLLIKAH
ncbi:MAG: DNA-binding HxlR family transcriptional regulator [Cocleimonas sp.]|jgi:DNA-binding HxlR family transcriptional regulator